MGSELAERLRDIDSTVATIWNTIFKERLSLSATEINPTPFALKFLEQLNSAEIVTDSGQKLIAVLGCGKGRDALFLAAKGYYVIPFEIAPYARESVKFQFDERDLTPYLIEVRGNFHDTTGLQPYSLDGVLAVQSLNYVPPNDLVAVLEMYKKHLKSDGMLAIVSYLRDGNVKPTDAQDLFKMRSLDTEGKYIKESDLFAFAFDLTAADLPTKSKKMKLRTWIYTMNQIKAIAARAGYNAGEAIEWKVQNRQSGEIEEFVYLLLTKNSLQKNL